MTRIPCYPKGKRCDQSYLRRGEPTPNCCMGHLQNLATTVLPPLAEHEVPYWLDYGSLLGAVREGGIIRHDSDIDIGVRFSHLPELRKAMKDVERAGLHFRELNPKEYLRVQMSRRNTLHICIFVWYSPDEYWSRFKRRRKRAGGQIEPGMLGRIRYMRPDETHGKGKDFPEAWITARQRIKFEGIEAWTPVEAEAMLAHRYGDTWRTPVKHHARQQPQRKEARLGAVQLRGA